MRWDNARVAMTRTPAFLRSLQPSTLNRHGYFRGCVALLDRSGSRDRCLVGDWRLGGGLPPEGHVQAVPARLI
jgi:hypothetical protein